MIYELPTSGCSRSGEPSHRNAPINSTALVPELWTPPLQFYCNARTEREIEKLCYRNSPAGIVFMIRKYSSTIVAKLSL